MAQERYDDGRIERERDFHNERYQNEVRGGVWKFYRAIDDCMDDHRQAVKEASRGRDVLEYGCGRGTKSLELAPICKSIVGIDISDVAAGNANEEAARRGLGNAHFMAMNAEEMNFPDGSFDIVFGSAIIHHLDISRAYAEIARVLRPGGQAIFVEPLGHNLAINSFRNRTPALRTPDEHPLLRPDIELARQYFRDIDLKFYGLTNLASAFVHDTPLFRPALAALGAVDQILFTIPPLRWQAWYVLIRLSR
ncbi:MAG: methyltransferase domain-containing protein [Geminicoccaceae bacterium]|nr:methyltransferase domain-containing protein [Geminicoccaceae bacterium]